MYTCGLVLVINLSGLQWNAFDQKVLEKAKVQCPIRYEKSPCVVKLFKYRDRGHGVLCGAPIKEKDSEG